MIKMLRADFNRLMRSTAFRIAIFSMIGLASLLMFVQATAMDYTVPLSRVIFLPMSMFGVAMGAFVSVFVGTDFSDGFIRNKLLATDRRSNLVISQIIVSCIACVICYALVTVFTTIVGSFFFERDVVVIDFIKNFLIGIFMSISTGCLFAVVTVIIGKKTPSIVWCMGLAFVMLFAAMRTNSVLVQKEYKDGVLNPNYVTGARRLVYEILHDLNPCGQASQLSSWDVWNPVRIIIINLVAIAVLSALGCVLFRKKNIN
jgi:hypothetical protein